MSWNENKDYKITLCLCVIMKNKLLCTLRARSLNFHMGAVGGSENVEVIFNFCPTIVQRCSSYRQNRILTNNYVSILTCLNYTHCNSWMSSIAADFSTTASVTRDFLDETFPYRWIGRGGLIAWTPRSSYNKLMDFFILISYIKHWRRGFEVRFENHCCQYLGGNWISYWHSLSHQRHACENSVIM